MSPTLLLTILICSMASGCIAFIALFPRKTDEKRFQKITTIATFLTSLATIIVGVATISVAWHQEEREKLQSQPLFTINFEYQCSEESGYNINEEYIVANEGKKTKNKTDVNDYTYLEINYNDMNNQKNMTKIIPYNNYFGADIYTNNLDGTIQYSFASSNNLERFVNLYREAVQYGSDHSNISVNVTKKHFFVIEYTDIFGGRHRIVKNETTEIDPEAFDEIGTKAKMDSGDIAIDATDPDVNIESIIATYF